MIANYHTHTYRCRHAEGDVADYCRTGIDAGLQELGFSDHAPLPDKRWPHVRMTPDELPGYEQAIETARRQFPSLSILKGLECEFSPTYEAYYRDELLGRRGFDYLCAAAHWFPIDGEWPSTFEAATDRRSLTAYADYLADAMASGLFAFVAHPDAFGCSYPAWDADAQVVSREILQTARDCAMPLEINAYGLRKPPVTTPDGPRPPYPWRPFWELAAEIGVTAIINSDAHRPADIVAGVNPARAMADELGLQVLERLPLTHGAAAAGAAS